MNTHAIGASHTHRLFEPQALRLRAELPAVTSTPSHTAMHDFLVPNLRPDLTGDAREREQRRRFIEPDSIFWSPASDTDDAA